MARRLLSDENSGVFQQNSVIKVRHSGPLEGSVRIVGAKNSALKLMAASLLCPGKYTFHNIPQIADVRWMRDLLEHMGAVTSQEADVLHIQIPEIMVPEAPYELVERMRASIVVLGPLLARFGEARVSVPGGDDFGHRPIDMHLRGLEEMGVSFQTSHGYIEGRTEGLSGSRVLLEFPSVGATENLLMAAVLAKGTTIIDNAAREPEIVDLADFLNAMGATIRDAGMSCITVHGVERLNPTTHVVIPDRIEAATYLAALGVSGGEITISGARVDHMEMLVEKLTEMGMEITSTTDGLLASSKSRLKSVDL